MVKGGLVTDIGSILIKIIGYHNWNPLDWKKVVSCSEKPGKCPKTEFQNYRFSFFGTFDPRFWFTKFCSVVDLFKLKPTSGFFRNRKETAAVVSFLSHTVVFFNSKLKFFVVSRTKNSRCWIYPPLLAPKCLQLDRGQSPEYQLKVTSTRVEKLA